MGAHRKGDVHDPLGPVVELDIGRVSNGRRIEGVRDAVAVEEPLEIRIEGRTLAVVMRTPGEDRELAAGFLLSEGVIRSHRDLFDITTCVPPSGEGQAVDVALRRPADFDAEKLSRHVFVSSSCGVCGKTSIDTVMKEHPPLVDDVAVSAKTIRSLPKTLGAVQANFQRTGGLHACALFTPEGEMIGMREDVGRHNALDKLTGWALLEKRLPLVRQVVLLSGRASFEMMQKAHVAGLGIVAAIGAPSSLAVRYARASGQTLIGFLRPRSFNLYASPERITS
ncbi:MAG: formate dehydrogenase accessory sulfurtransferase FdhD [Chthoniobacteraceae bacterium]